MHGGRHHDHIGLSGGPSSPGLNLSQAEPALCVHALWPSFCCQRGAMGFDFLLSREEQACTSLPGQAHGLHCPICLVSQPLCSGFLLEERRDAGTGRDTASLRTVEKVRLGDTSALGFFLQLGCGVLYCGICGCPCRGRPFLPAPASLLLSLNPWRRDLWAALG